MKAVLLLVALLASASGMRLPLQPRSTAVPYAQRTSLKMQSGPREPTQGIQPVLGGGKTQADLEKNPVVVNGSKAAFAVVLVGLIFGATNEDQVAEIAKSQKKPCVEKITNGKKITCPQASVAAASAFPYA